MTKGESATEWQSDKVSQIAKQWQSAIEWQNAAKWQSAPEWQNDSDAYTACFQRLGVNKGLTVTDLQHNVHIEVVLYHAPAAHSLPVQHVVQRLTETTATSHSVQV